MKNDCDIGYPDEVLDEDEDDGTMVESKEALEEAIIGRKIVSAAIEPYKENYRSGNYLSLTLDNGKKVRLIEGGDCCAFTTLEKFFLDPTKVSHAIAGVGTTEGYTKWHIFADHGDIMQLDVSWSCGNPFYYGYGFDIAVEDIS